MQNNLLQKQALFAQESEKPQSKYDKVCYAIANNDELFNLVADYVSCPDAEIEKLANLIKTIPPFIPNSWSTKCLYRGELTYNGGDSWYHDGKPVWTGSHREVLSWSSNYDTAKYFAENRGFVWKTVGKIQGVQLSDIVTWRMRVRQGESHYSGMQAEWFVLNTCKATEAEPPQQSRYAAKQEPKDLSRIDAIVNEMMPVLKPGLPKPKIKTINTKENTLGQCLWISGLRNGVSYSEDNTTISIQQSVLGDEQTLRRIVAHELAHHEDFLVNVKPEFDKMGYHTYRMYKGIRRDDGHGANWQAIAARFNAKYGANFVTRTSDQNMVIDKSVLPPYFVLIQEDGGKLGWQQGSRFSKKQQRYLFECATAQYPHIYPLKLVKTSSPFFRNGPTIGGYGRIRPSTEEKRLALEDLWKNGEDLLPQYATPPSPEPKPEDMTREELIKRMQRLMPRRRRYSSTLLQPSKAASPDFGYSKYNGREFELSEIHWQETRLPDEAFEISAISPGEENAVGGIRISPMPYINPKYVYVVSANIKGDWRGTGLGQILYDKAIAAAKELGYERFYGGRQSKDAQRAWWSRLTRRYRVHRDEEQDGSPYIALNDSMKTVTGSVE